MAEFERRGKDVNKKIFLDFYVFQDLPMYILNAEAVVTGKRRYLKRPDLSDVTQRLRTMYPPVVQYKKIGRAHV